MQSGHSHIGVERCLFEQRDVGDVGATRNRAFKQVVAQNLPFGQTRRQHGVQGLDMQQTLAGEAAFAKQVLVDLGTRRAVRVNAALPGE